MKTIDNNKLVSVVIPEDISRTLFNRIEPIIKRYEKSQRMNRLMPTNKTMSFNELVVSIYTQGVSDGNQLPRQ